MAKITVTEVSRDSLGRRMDLVVCTGTASTTDDYIDANDLGIGTVRSFYGNGNITTGTPTAMYLNSGTPNWVHVKEVVAQRFTIIGESQESTGGD